MPNPERTPERETPPTKRRRRPRAPRGKKTQPEQQQKSTATVVDFKSRAAGERDDD